MVRLEAQLAAIILGLFLFSATVDAKCEESLTLRIFDPNFRQSDKQMTALLKKADLESHGYRKEVTTKLVSVPGIDKPVYQKSYFYYKIDNCSLPQNITKELRTLLPGAIGVNLVTKSNNQFQARNVTSMNQCKMGLEVHFKEAESYRNGKHSKTRLLYEQRSSFTCLICFIFKGNAKL